MRVVRSGCSTTIYPVFLKRQTEGSVICASCGVLVGVTDDRCYNCGRRNPGLWGYGPALRRFGQDLGFVPFVMGATVTLYALSLLLSRSNVQAMMAAELGDPLSPWRQRLVRRCSGTGDGGRF